MIDPLIALASAAVIVVIGWVLFRPKSPLFFPKRRTDRRVLREDALKHIHRCARYDRPATTESVAGALQISSDAAAALLAELEAHQFIERHNGTLALTDAGHAYAVHVVRAHRLWERHLADETGFDASEWHQQADAREHELTADEINTLAQRLGNPIVDPHGDPIPTADGTWVTHGGQPLTALAAGHAGRIVHIEDEPDAVYAQLLAEKIHPGQTARVVSVSAECITFWTNGDEHVLAPIVAANISVVPLPDAETHAPATGTLRLADLAPGETAAVTALSPAVRGAERRRFLDLGIVPGTEISAEFVSPGGDPTAYRIRGALIALRHDQAENITVHRPTSSESQS